MLPRLLLKKNMAPLSNIYRKIFLSTILQRNGRLSYRLLSTSQKKEDADKTCESASPEAIYRKVPDFSKPKENKNWVSFGFDEEDESKDRFQTHFMYFSFYTFTFCGIVFLYLYLPDKGRYGWARREAFIRLHEREQLGLEPIDPNYIDPSKIVLPPDEELTEEDMVI